MQAYFHLSHIHICIFFYLRSCVEPNVHSFSYVCVKLRKCGHSLAFSVRLCVVCKPLRKIFLRAKIFTRKETHVKKEKEKKFRNIAQSHSNSIRSNILLDCFTYEQIKNETAASEEELSIVVQKCPAIFDKSNKDFHRKDIYDGAFCVKS